MRYLLLAMLASLAYLLGVALLYGEHGTLDLYLLATEVGGSGSAGTLPALSLITVGLLLKAAVFPLHVWLPAAHSQAPGAVSAVLSGLVVKTAIYLLYRLWFWTAEGLDLTSAAFLLGLIGASAILYGSLAALVQVQLKRVVAYSTVAQLGYLMLVFPLFGDPRAASSAWTGTGCQLFAHGLAKAGMFAGADRRQPACLFAFGLAGVSLMGLPPSAGFLAKWQLLESAWMQSAWGWVAVLLTGSLLAAGYIFRVLAAAFVAPSAGSAGPASAAHELACPPGQRVSLFLSLPALALALASVLLGFWAAPLFEMLAVAPPAVVDLLLPGDSWR
jgi:formate hydrogenlyase subunit 3/multisubunit Na+/H+ antiporter MnhD subunit